MSISLEYSLLEPIQIQGDEEVQPLRKNKRPIRYGTDTSDLCRKCSRCILSDSWLTKGTLHSIMMMLLGGVIGGPLGMLIAKACHLSGAAAFWVPITGLCTGVGTGRVVSKSKCCGHKYYHTLTSWNPPKSIVDNLRDIIVNQQIQDAFPQFLTTINSDPTFQQWYIKRLRFYHTSETPSDAIMEAKFIIEDLTEILNGWLIYNENDHTISIVVYVERFVMMGLYWDVMGQCRDLEKQRDDIFINNRVKIANKSVSVSDEALLLLNTLANKQTASLKINCILAVSELLGKKAESEGIVTCDKLIEKFVNLLGYSSIRYPFAELRFIDTFSPQGLKGRESYAVSTFMASIYYISRCE